MSDAYSDAYSDGFIAKLALFKKKKKKDSKKNDKPMSDEEYKDMNEYMDEEEAKETKPLKDLKGKRDEAWNRPENKDKSLEEIEKEYPKYGSADDAYTQGFIHKCAAAGVDPETLVKTGARGDQLVKLINVMSTHKKLKDPLLKSTKALANRIANKGGTDVKPILGSGTSHLIRNIKEHKPLYNKLQGRQSIVDIDKERLANNAARFLERIGQ